jgi:PST family polysaccharide transporter
MVSNLSILIYMRIDQIMLGSMIGSVAVGQYSAAIRISEIFYYIPVVFTTAFTPIITRLRQSDPSRYLFQFHRLFFVLTLGSYVCSILMHFGSIPIIRIIFGAQYAQAAPILAIHIWTCVFVFLGVAQGPWYVNEGMTQRAMARSLVGAASNILLNLFLIPRYGPLGAAYATLFSQALSSFLFNASHRKTRPIFMIQLKALLLIPPRNPKITSPPLVQI